MGSSVERFLQQTGGQGKPPVDTTTQVGAFLGGEDERRRLRTAQTMGGDGDAAGRILGLEAKTGLPHDMIERNLDQIQAEVDKGDFDLEKFRRTSPIMSSWLAEHPKHFALASNDLTKLGWLEKQWRNVKSQFGAGMATTQLEEIGTRAMLGMATPADRKKQKELEDKMALNSVLPEDLDLSTLGQVPGAMAQQLPIFAKTTAASLAGAGVGFVAGRGPGAKLGWRIGAGVEAGRMEASLAYLDLEKIRDDRGEPLSRNATLGAALAVGVVNGSLEMMGFEEMAKTVPGLRTFTRDGLKQALTKTTTRKALIRYLENIGEAAATEGVTEFLQEMVGSTAGEFAKMLQDGTVKNEDGTVSNITTGALIDRIFSPDHLAAAFEAGKQGAMAGGGMTSVTGVGQVSADVGKARRAKAAAQVMNDLATTVNSSRMMERLPAKMQEAVERLAADGHVPNLYAPLDVWNTYWQSKKIDPEQAATAVLGAKGAEAYAEAERTGGDLEIPTGKYATTLAATDHHEFFVNELRSGPNELSAREAQEAVQRMDEESAAIQQEAKNERKDQIGEIVGKLQKQLKESGFDEKTAKTYSSLYEHLFNLDPKMSPAQVFERMGLKVSRVEDGKPTGLADLVLNQQHSPEQRQLSEAELIALIGQPVAGDAANDGDLLNMLPAYYLNSNHPADLRAQAIRHHMKNVMGIHDVIEDMLGDEDLVKKVVGEFWSEAKSGGPEEGEEWRGESEGVAELRARYPHIEEPGKFLFQAEKLSTQGDMDRDTVVPHELSPNVLRYIKANSSDVEYHALFKAMDNNAHWGPLEDFLYTKPAEWRKALFTALPDFNAWYREQTTLDRPLPELLAGFHSKAERVIEEKMGGRATVQEVQALLRDVKDEEKRWTGIQEYLDGLSPDEKITKDQVMKALQTGRLAIKEVNRLEELGGNIDDDAVMDHAGDIEAETYRTVANEIAAHVVVGVVGKYAGVNIGELPSNLELEWQVDFDDLPYDTEKPPTQHAWRLFGPLLKDYFANPDHGTIVRASTFREAITAARDLILDEITKTPEDAETRELKDMLEEFQEAVADDAMEHAYDTYDDAGENSAGYSSLTLPGGENYREILITLPRLKPEYLHDHFEGAENVVVHFRLKDREDASGGKMLFVEELQSDWHQAGRDYGYRDEKAIARIQLGKDALLDKRQKVWDEITRLDPQETLTRTGEAPATLTEAEVKRYNDLILETEDLSQQLRDMETKLNDAIGSRSAVPNAPFKSTWHELGLKRILRMAAEQGYDSIGWTTGEQQANRYNLSRVVDEITWEKEMSIGPKEGATFVPDPNNPLAATIAVESKPTGNITVRGNKFGEADARNTVFQRTVSPDDLVNMVGKELAAKIRERSEHEISGDFSGDELIVGGHGMREFYDKLIPSFLRRFNKKYGAEVGTTALDFSKADVAAQTIEKVKPEVHHMTLTPALKRAALDEEFTLFQSDWKYRAVKSRFAGSVAEISGRQMKHLPLLEFMNNYGIDPDMLGDIELVTNRNPKPGEGKFRTTILMKQRLVDQGAVQDWTDRMHKALEAGRDISSEPPPAIREETTPIGHIANDSIEELERFVADLQFKPTEFRQSITSEMRQRARVELSGMISELNELRRTASFQGDIPRVTELAGILEGWLQIQEALEKRDTPTLMRLRSQLRSTDPRGVENLASKIPSLIDYLELMQKKGDEADPRGRIRMGASGIDIELLKNADLSTFIHETGHFFLETMQELAPENEAVAADLDAVRNWLGMEKGAKFERAEHELFARGFERYLMEGKAPVPRLQMAFARMKAWMVGIYRSLGDLDVNLTDEVRGVFDRLLASSEELDKAEKEQNIQPLFADPKAVGLTQAEADSYNESFRAARLAAEEELTAKIMREFEREKSRVWDAEKIKVRAEVGQEADQDPILRTYSLLKNGKLPSGEEVDGFTPFKLDKADVLEQFKVPVPERLLATTGGKTRTMSPATAADLFGFSSPEELLGALANSEDPKDWIEKTTNSRMRSRRYEGTPLKTIEIPLEAKKAVHNEKRAQLMQKELQILAAQSLPTLKGMIRKMTRRLPRLEEIQAEATRIVESKIVRDIKPDAYRRAEAESAKKATDLFLKGDFEGAFDQKQRELLNHELFRAASTAKDAVTAGVKIMRKFDDKKTRQRLGRAGANYLEQIDGLLERFDFREMSGPKIDRKQSLRDFLNEQSALGLQPDLPENVTNEAYRKNYKELSFEEFQGVVNSAKLIRHLATLKNKLLASNRARTIQQAVDDMIGRMRENFDVETKEPIDLAPGLTTRLKRGVKGIIAAHTKMEFLFEFLDGNKDNGPVWKHLFEPLAVAESTEHLMMQDAVKGLKSIFSAYSKAERSRWFWNKTHVAEVNMSFTKGNMLAVALNWGNDGNRQALMEGYGWNEKQVQAILRHLDAKDIETVNRVGGLLETFWPQIEKLEKDLNGVAPEKVETSPAILKNGVITGHYYPIAFDAQLSWKQALLEKDQQTNEMFGGRWAQVGTRHGHTKERTGSGGKPVKLDLSILTQHITNVVHDLSHRRAIIDVTRLTQRDEVRQAIENAAGKDMYRQIYPWLVNIARGQQTEFQNPIEGLLARGRMGATVVNMGWKMSTAIVQFLSYTNTIKELGPKYSALGMSDFWAQPWKMRESWDFIKTRSPFMDQRLTNYDRDVRDALSNMNVAGVKSGPLSFIGAYTGPVRDSFFMFIGLMDMAVSVPSWMGAYRKAMDGAVDGIGKGEEEAAIQYADKIVRETQGVGAAKDMAAVQRGGEAYKIFAMFYSYFSVLFNQFAKTTNQLRLDKNVAKYVASLAMLWFVPAVLQDLILGRGPGDDADKDEWMLWLAKTEAKYPFQTIIILRDIINGMDKFGYEPSAALDMFGSIATTLKNSGKLFTDEEISRADAKAAAEAVGYATQLPSRQLWQTGEYMYDWLSGAEDIDNPLKAAWQALVTGRKKE